MKNGNNLAGDETLYHQYLCGDDTGLDALMKRYGDPLTLYIDGNLHDIHEAEELMIDVFADLFTKKPKIRDGGFKAYLYKAARHMALRHKSKRRLMFSLDALTEEPDGQQLAEEVTGKTVKQITNLVYRGKESLRKLLEREGITNAEP